MRGLKSVIIVSVILLMISGCTITKQDNDKETEVSDMVLNKYADYLYYLELDSYNFEAMPANDSPLFTGGCSSIRKDNLYGRNLDLNYCDTPEFVISLSKSADRFSSIGICANPAITSDVSKMSEDDFLAMPCITNDGINENGVIVSVNIVNATGIDKMDHTAPGKTEVHASRVVRYLLDRSVSAEHAIVLLDDIDVVGGFVGSGLHWMIADKDNTYVVEIIDGKLVSSKNDYYYMTNFYLNHGPKADKQYIADKEFNDLPLLNNYAIGVERYDLIKSQYSSINSVDDMKAVLEMVKGTATYLRPEDDRWYSEFTGENLSISSSKADFDDEYLRQIELYKNRDRLDPKGDWISWHSSVYEIDERKLHVYSQEDYERVYSFGLNG